jgi:hypothetical protein
MTTGSASQAVARSQCFLCAQTSDRVIWEEDGIEGLLCRCGMVYTNQAVIREPTDLTKEFHPNQGRMGRAKLSRWAISRGRLRGGLLPCCRPVPRL